MRIKQGMLEKRVGDFFKHSRGLRTGNGKGLLCSDCTANGRRGFARSDGTFADALEVTGDPVNQPVTERSELFRAEFQWRFSVSEVIEAHVFLPRKPSKRSVSIVRPPLTELKTR